MDRPAIPPEQRSTAQQFALPDGTVEEDFHRGLKERHIQMIAIGGAIGVGRFLGSAKAIQQAGPSLLVSYAVAGVAIFLIMRALGELLLYRQVAGSFATYADEFVGPGACGRLVAALTSSDSSLSAGPAGWRRRGGY